MLLSLSIHCRDSGVKEKRWPSSRYRLAYYRELALAAERASMTAVWLEGATGRDEDQPGGIDPVVAAASLASVARRIGLVAAISLDDYEPYHVARATASLDNISGGRCGWLLASGRKGAGGDSDNHADNHADIGAMSPIDRDRRRQELLGVTRRLWDSWKDGAIRIDKEAGIFADPRYVQPIHHRGKYYQVRGPLNVVRPVQGHPVLARALRQDEAELVFAAGQADWIVAEADCPEQAAAQSAAIRRAAAAAGRDGAQLRISHRASLVFEGSRPSDEEPTGLAFRGSAERMAEEMSRWVKANATEGFHLELAEPLADIVRVADELVPALRRQGWFGSPPEKVTLRERLGLSRPAAVWMGEGVQ